MIKHTTEYICDVCGNDVPFNDLHAVFRKTPDSTSRTDNFADICKSCWEAIPKKTETEATE